MLVREIMSSPAVTVRDDATLKAAITQLARHGISAMPVVDDRGRLCGVVSEADLVRETVVPDQRAHELPVRLAAPPRTVVADVMSTHAVTVTSDTDVAAAAGLMTSTSVKSLPVVDHGHLVGVVSRRDVIGVLARPDERIEAEIDELVRQSGHGWLVDVTDGVAELDGPRGESEERLAEVLAGTVPGLVGVRFRPARTR